MHQRWQLIMFAFVTFSPTSMFAQPSALPEPRYTDEITVRAQPLQQIEERAIDAEREALPILAVAPSDELGRFPDRDAAGAAQRLPGVTVIRDQGDARLVLVRGFLPAYNSATLDGQRMPAGEADERSVALDLLPTELLDAVEVTKTVTPDMDGDALGGVVNLVTRRPPADRGTVLSGSIGAGLDDGSDGARRLASTSLGGWIASRRLGMTLSASHLDADRGVDSVERDWELDDADDADNVGEAGEGAFQLVEERLQDHTSDRRRNGLGATLEWHPRDSSTLLLRSLWSEFEDLERRRARVERAEEDPGVSVLTSELKDRREAQSLASVSASAQHRFGGWLVEPSLSWSRAKEDERDRLDTIFAATDFAASRASPSPENYELEAFRTESDNSSNQDLVARLDLGRELRGGSERSDAWTVRVGGKWRHKEAQRDDNLRVFEPGDEEDVILLSEVVDPGWQPADPFFGSRQDLGPFADPRRARDLLRRLVGEGALEMLQDSEEDLGDFEAEEDVGAAYVLLEGALSDRVSLLSGLRFESTDTRYKAGAILLGDDGEPAEVVPARGGGSYDELLPSVILRAAPNERNVLRAAVTRGLARPALSDLTPARLVIPEDKEILSGNPDLSPTTAWNLDLQWQHDLPPAAGTSAPASLSLALYRKELSDVISLVRSPGDETADGLGPFTRIEPRNAGDATVTGFELSLRSRLGGGALEGLGLAANLTWSDSEAELLGRGTSALPGQADVSGSVVLSYETRRLSISCLFSYRDEILEELGESPSFDVYLESRSQLDLSLQVRASRRWTYFAEAFNLTETEFGRFEGVPGMGSQRSVLQERVGWWATFGVRFDA